MKTAKRNEEKDIQEDNSEEEDDEEDFQQDNSEQKENGKNI